MLAFKQSQFNNILFQQGFSETQGVGYRVFVNEPGYVDCGDLQRENETGLKSF